MTSKPIFGKRAPPFSTRLSAADLAGALDDVLAETPAPPAQPPSPEKSPDDMHVEDEADASRTPSRAWDQSKILDYIGRTITAELDGEPAPARPAPAHDPEPEPEVESEAGPEADFEPETNDGPMFDSDVIESAASPVEAFPDAEKAERLNDRLMERDEVALPRTPTTAPSEILSPGIAPPDLVTPSTPPPPLLQAKPDDLPSLETLLRTLKTLHGDQDEDLETTGTSERPAPGGSMSLETVLSDLRHLYSGGILAADDRKTDDDAPEEADDDEDVLILDDRFLVEDASAPDDEILVLDDRFVVAAGSVSSPSKPSADQAFAALLTAPLPTDDESALAYLAALGGAGSPDARLAAVAANLTLPFGTEQGLPRAALAAWRMVDEKRFEAEYAAQLAAITETIGAWEDRHVDFLVLEPAEYALIEHLFDRLPPSRYGELLARVMALKSLSHRRIGMLRRVPAHLHRIIEPLIRSRRLDDALVELAAAKALMTRIAAPPTVTPVARAALKAFESLDRMARVLTE